MKKLKISVLLLLLLLMPCCVCGCWDKNELNQLVVILGVGIDEAKTPGEMEMTIQIERNGGNSQSSTSVSSVGSQSNGSNYLNIQDAGGSVPTIFTDYSHELSRKMFISQNQAIIFGENFAKNGIRNSMNFFLRDYQGRLNVDIFVAKGKAGDILNLNPTMGKIPVYEISQMIDAQSANSESTKLIVADLMKDLSSSTKSMVAPYIESIDENGEKHFSISGSAVFKGDKLVGELNKEETRGYLWVIDKVRNGKITVNVLNEQAVLQIGKAKGQIVPELAEDGSLSIRVDITEEGIIKSQTGPLPLDTPEKMRLLESTEVNEIKAEILQTLGKTREMGTDIYGFGEAIHQKYPQKWSTIEKDWGNLYKTIPVNVHVTAKVQGGGRIVSPDYPDEESKK